MKTRDPGLTIIAAKCLCSSMNASKCFSEFSVPCRSYSHQVSMFLLLYNSWSSLFKKIIKKKPRKLLKSTGAAHPEIDDWWHIQLEVSFSFLFPLSNLFIVGFFVEWLSKMHPQYSTTFAITLSFDAKHFPMSKAYFDLKADENEMERDFGNKFRQCLTSVM